MRSSAAGDAAPLRSMTYSSRDHNEQRGGLCRDYAAEVAQLVVISLGSQLQLGP
jgi:hypothetical protein